MQVVVELTGRDDGRVWQVEVWQRFRDAASDDEAHMGAALAQHSCHLLRAHAAHVDVVDMQQVIAAAQPTILHVEDTPVSTGNKSRSN